MQKRAVCMIQDLFQFSRWKCAISTNETIFLLVLSANVYVSFGLLVFHQQLIRLCSRLYNTYFNSQWQWHRQCKQEHSSIACICMSLDSVPLCVCVSYRSTKLTLRRSVTLNYLINVSLCLWAVYRVLCVRVNVHVKLKRTDLLLMQIVCACCRATKSIPCRIFCFCRIAMQSTCAPWWSMTFSTFTQNLYSNTYFFFGFASCFD